MGEITFRTVTTYKDTATLDAEDLKAALCAGVDTPECKEAVDRCIGVPRSTYGMHAASESWESGRHAKAERTVEIVAYERVLGDFDQNGSTDRLIVVSSQRDASIAVFVGILLQATPEATVIFMEKPQVVTPLAQAGTVSNLVELQNGLDLTRLEQAKIDAAFTELHQFISQYTSGVPGIRKLRVEDLNHDTIPDIEIETGRKVGGRHEFIQFLSQSPAAALAPHRKALVIITGATDDATLLAKLGALEKLATQTGRSLEATIRAKLVKALVATYRAELALIAGSQDEAALKAKAEHLITLAEQTGRGIVEVIRAKADKARQREGDMH